MGDILLVRCVCGLLIRHPASKFRVHCACGESEEVSVLRRRVAEETVTIRTERGDVDGWT
jgi:hypothetical protein